MKDTIIIILLLILSLLLGALFLQVEELRQAIPETTHVLLDNAIRESVSSTIREEFIKQENMGNVFINDI